MTAKTVGPVEDFVNLIRSERGLPTRGPGYAVIISRQRLTAKLVHLVSACIISSCAGAVPSRCMLDSDAIDIFHIGSGPAPIVTRLSFDNDNLLLEEIGGRARCRTNPVAASRLSRSFRSSNIQAILAEVRQDPERYHSLEDARGISIRAVEQEAHLDYIKLPPDMLTFLMLVEAEFSSAFGRNYRLSISRHK